MSTPNKGIEKSFKSSTSKAAFGKRAARSTAIFIDSSFAVTLSKGDDY
jgi:hypothetical protein